jgi:hypothetical protein
VIDSDTLKGSDVYELIPLVDLVLARTLVERVNNKHKMKTKRQNLMCMNHVFYLIKMV